MDMGRLVEILLIAILVMRFVPVPDAVGVAVGLVVAVPIASPTPTQKGPSGHGKRGPW